MPTYIDLICDHCKCDFKRVSRDVASSRIKGIKKLFVQECVLIEVKPSGKM